MDLKREPLVVSGAAVALAQVVLTAVVLMGWWNITAEQAAAWGEALLASAVAALIPLLTSVAASGVGDPSSPSLLPTVEQPDPNDDY